MNKKAAVFANVLKRSRDTDKQVKFFQNESETLKIPQNEQIVAIFSLCKTLGIRIVPVKYAKKDKKDTYAHLVDRPNKGTYIFVDAEASVQQMRFDVATLLYSALTSPTTSTTIAKSKNNKNLRHAKVFAAKFLMPTEALRDVLFELDENGNLKYLVEDGSNFYINPRNIHFIAERFGVDFKLCAKRIFHGEKIPVKILGVETAQEFKEFLLLPGTTQAARRRIVPNWEDSDYAFKSCLINNMYYPPYDKTSEIVKETIRLETVKNDCLIEGVVNSAKGIEAFLTKYRLHPEDYQEEMDKLTEEQRIMIGHYETLKELESYPMNVNFFLNLYNGIFRYSEIAIKSYRYVNNMICGATFETEDATKIYDVVGNLYYDAKFLLEKSDTMSNSEYIQKVNYLTSRFLVCHPFDDGNGRVSRLFANYMLLKRGLLPVFINAKASDKSNYLNAVKGLSDSARSSNMWDFKSPKFNEVIYDGLIKTVGEIYPANEVLRCTKKVDKENDKK